MMKKAIALFLCLCMIFSLTACAGLDAIRNTELPPVPTPESPSQGANATDTETAAMTPEPAEITVPPEAAVGADLGDQVYVYLKQTKETEYAPEENGLPILVFSYVTPTVRMDMNTQAADEINEQLRLLDELYYSGSGSDGGKNHLYEMALDYYSYAKLKGDLQDIIFSSNRSVHVCRTDGSVISLLYWTSVYTGGSLGEHSYVGRNYSSETGEELSLDMLSPDPETLRKDLRDILVSVVKEDAGLYSDLSVTDRDMDAALAVLVRDGNWYFSGEGMVFFPDFGELRAADQGIDMFTVPYSRLVGVIDEKYLPAPRENSGKMSVVRVSDVEDGTVKSIDRLVVSEGEELYLQVEGTLYDVTISSAAYYDQQEGTRFFETERHWYASFMDDCALQIVTALPEGMPNLMISYTDAAHEQHRLLLSENGVDGTPVLVDDSIVAVG